MKCESVACIWSSSPPSQHRVTASAALDRPPTLYTGGADGSIFWWDLSVSDTDFGSRAEIKPVAMLCGHVAPIADLGICAASWNDRTDSLGNSLADEDAGAGALISVCNEGALCVWSRGSGHCQRRRKLAPWTGRPSLIRTLSSNRRYVCIGCLFVDELSRAVDHSGCFGEGGEIFADVEHKRPTKCTVLLVDTYTLTIVRTVVHGNLSFGLPSYMNIFSRSDDREKSYAILVDNNGRTQKVPLSKDVLHPDVDEKNEVLKYNSDDTIGYCTDSFSDSGKVLCCGGYDNVIAFLFFDCCLFKIVDTNVTVGEISFSGNYFSHYTVDSSRMKGCMFLDNALFRRLTTSDSTEFVQINFMVWDTRGSAVIYLVSFANEVFKAEPLFSLDASSHPEYMRESICFSQLDTYILRIDSICFQQKDTVLWKPFISIWSLQLNHEGLQSCEMFGQYDFIEWSASSVPHQDSKGSDCEGYNMNYASGDACGTTVDNNIYPTEGQIVSSSMIISESSCMPSTIVYGYVNGNIEVIQLDVVHKSYSSGCQPKLGANPNSCRRHFSGHTSSVLCLASHRMVGSAKGRDFCYVLISGSKDCTIRIWDLVTSIPISVLHHHVAPIRQIIFPPCHTERPWIDCFLSIGEDSCVALVSPETLRVERILPGHPGYLVRVVWDGERGYITCLCRSHGRSSDAGDVLYIWDVKSGAREQILKGTSAHSMFHHFCSRITMTSIGRAVWTESTSASSQLTPLIEDVDHPDPPLRSLVKGSAAASVVRPSPKASEPLLAKTLVRRKTFSESRQDEPAIDRSIEHSINSHCPSPGVASLKFDLTSLTLPYQGENVSRNFGGMHDHNLPSDEIKHDDPTISSVESSKGAVNSQCMALFEECIIRFSLSLLHSWDVDSELDQLLITDMKLKKPDVIISSGLAGDRGSLTLTFPGRNDAPELWKLSSEFSAMRSLTMVSLAQHMVSFHSSSTACSALAAFYTRNFAEKVPGVKPPSLQLLVSFWQDKSEHVRMAARSLFHCAASSEIPLPLCSQTVNKHVKFVTSMVGKDEKNPEVLRKKSSLRKLIPSQEISKQHRIFYPWMNPI